MPRALRGNSAAMEGFLPAQRRSARVVSMIRGVHMRAATIRAIATSATIAIATVATLGLSTSACADPKISMATGPREYTDSDYAQVLERWTRTRSLVSLSELDTLLTVTATFESWDFRW